MSADSDKDGWPDGWPKPKEGRWITDEGNPFIRFSSTTPGEMVMMYREFNVPEGTEAVEISWRQRITGLTVGSKAWFDARIIAEFTDAERKKVEGPQPRMPYARKDTAGWEEKTVQALVPEGAKLLKFMPSLFQVESGTFDIDDVVIRPIDATALREENKKAEEEKAASLAKNAATRQEKAAKNLGADGSIIPNGNMEADSKGKSWPDGWGHPKTGSYEKEEGNSFIRITAPEPDKMNIIYQTYDLPPGIQALELKFRTRVTNLKKGKMPWFDARIITEFKDAAGKKISQGGAPNMGSNTKGWVEKSSMFLVPEGAVSIVIMPSLFQVTSGTMDLDDVTLKAIDPAPIYAKKEADKKAAEARYVPPEEPKKDKWPKMLRVVGNKVLDSDDKEVWLQGVNAGGLETLPHDMQVIKSVVVAIDEWKSNCVRLPINETFWYGKSPYQKDGGKEYRDKIDQIVTLCGNRGAYLVLDLHRFRAPKQEHADFWKDAATHYKDNPVVLFDIFNEPYAISWEIWQKGGFVSTNKTGVDESQFISAEERKKLEGFESIGMQGLIDAVRSTGAKNIIIAGGIFWCNDLTGVLKGYALDDKGGNGIMYSWHTYHWHPGWERIPPIAEKYPIFLGEVGASPKGVMGFIPEKDQEDPYTFSPDMLGFIQKYKIHWTGWCFHPKAAPCMIEDWTYKPTPYWGEFAKRALGGEAFEMKKMR
ncbi:glycoside hydrolase family 5 [Verrucomicrobia bacterium LW23]|nr:glycoside hydrolase family 5 [Verrucomicrobia bacterium LW23]